MVSSGPSSSGGVSPLRNCDHCGSLGRVLRKCVGCSLVGYCSKECQKAAWSQHESQCRDAIGWQNGDKISVEKPTGGKFGGLANAHACIHAVDGFLDAHAWAFYTDARALVAYKGGAEWLQSTPPKVVNTRLRPSFANPAARWDRNSSTPFKFESSSDITSTEYDCIVSTGSVHSWSSEAMTTARRNSLRKLQARFGAEFAGLIPVLVPSAAPRSRGSTLRVLGTDQQCVYPGRFGQELKKWE